MAKYDLTRTDFSSFTSVILMLVGALVTVLMVNVAVIASSPAQVEITTILGDPARPAERDAHGIHPKSPCYVEVLRDRLILQPEGETVHIKDLESPENGFERLLQRTSARRDEQYIVLLVRPYAAHIARQIKKAVLDRKLDVGMDLLERDVPVRVVRPPGTPDAATAMGTAGPTT